MIDLYTWSTPNGRKISILLEELNVKYKVFPINIIKNEQFNDSFLKISPNNKIPAIFIAMVVEMITHIYGNISISLTIYNSICLGHDTSFLLCYER